MRFSITKKIILLILTMIIIISLSTFAMYHSIQSIGEQVVEKSSMLIVKSIEEGIIHIGGDDLYALSPEKKQRLRRLISALTTRRGNILSIVLIDSSHKIILSSTKEIEGSIYRNPEEINMLNSWETKIYHRTWDDLTKVLDIIVPFEKNGVLRVVLSRYEIESFIHDLPLILLISLSPIIFLFIIGIIIITRIYHQPLQSLNQAIAKFSEGDFKYRINYTRQDEFTDTFTALNRSMDRMAFLKEGYKTTERKIYSLLQAVQDSIIVLDTEQMPSSYNKATLKLFKTTDQKFTERFLEILAINQPLKELIHNASQQGKKIAEKDMPLFFTEELHLSMRVTVQPLWEEDKFLGTFITLKDLRSIKEIEHNLLRAMKYGVITNLTSSISHELKNPLSALAMHGEIVENRIQKTEFAGKEQSLKSLHTIQSELKRLNRIIHQFLSLARKSKTRLDFYECNTLIQEVILLVQQQALENKITLNIDLKQNMPKLYGDADQIKQVILNILLNAFDAIEKGGQIKIESKQENNRIKLFIEDNGKGIPAAIQKQIFELYFSTKEEGGGIGLALCKNIIEAHEGTITFRSTEGKGTQFCITLPIREKTITSTRAQGSA
jgi:signal transduction histidine kinase